MKSEACQLFLVPSRSSNPPLYPSKGCELGSVLQLLLFRCFLLGLTFEPFKELGVRHLPSKGKLTRYFVVQNMNFKRGMRPMVSRTRLYSTSSNFKLQQQSTPSHIHTLSGTSRWQLRKTLGLPTSRRNSRNDQGTQIVMTWISLSSKTDFSFQIT